MESFVIDNACVNFTKRDSMSMSSEAWKDGITNKKVNVMSGFKASGIWPLSFAEMQKRWRLCHDGGIDSTNAKIQPWIKTREVMRSEVLSLPAPIDRSRKRRKTLDVNNRLLTREQLNCYDE